MGSIKESLAYKNIIKRPGRSWALILLTALLSLSVFMGTAITGSLKGGLESLKNRLGADIMVVPYEASTKSSLENIVLQGNTGYFYMDESIYEEIKEMDGISQISPQLFLASTSSGCCSVPVQIVGYDPETDFTVRPWLKNSKQDEVQDMEIVVGNDLNAFVGDTLTFYNSKVTVAGKLDKTGTNLDTAVYCNEDTIKALISSSVEMNMNIFKDIDPDKVVSCVLINVEDGYTVEEVLNEINLHIKDVKAVQTKDMISGVSESLEGVSLIIEILMVAVWILALAIIAISFAISLRERKKEFAVLRAVGASKSKVGKIVMEEGFIISITGGIIGILLGCILIFPFNNMIEGMLNLPYLLPGIGKIALIALISVVCAILASTVISFILSKRISGSDASFLLRD